MALEWRHGIGSPCGEELRSGINVVGRRGRGVTTMRVYVYDRDSISCEDDAANTSSSKQYGYGESWQSLGAGVRCPMRGESGGGTIDEAVGRRGASVSAGQRIQSGTTLFVYDAFGRLAGSKAQRRRVAGRRLECCRD